MADDEKKKLEEEKKRKQAEIERKRAEVRARMEEASKAKKAKKGFMTPERKKKLRLLLRKKAAEELKKEQERKAAERRRIIEERCGKAKIIDEANEGQLKKICKDYYDRMYICEEQKWDLEREVRKRDWEISELNSQVNDLRGKFMKPTLKKVSKYENKFAKLQKKAAEFNFRNQLKVVKKKEFTLEEEDKEKKPDWSKKGDEKKEGEEEAPAAPAAPAEGVAAPAPEDGETAEKAEGAKEGDQPPAEGESAEVAATPEGEEDKKAEDETPAEPEKEKTPEPPPETGFETFKKLVINENYDVITLPETIIPPSEDREAVAIPNYSIVENRRDGGDGVIMYVKDSLKYKVVDLTTATAENEHAILSFEDLLEKLKKNGQAAEAAALEAAASPPPELAQPGDAAPSEGAPPAEGAPATEGAPTTEGAAPPAEGTQAPPADQVPATEGASESAAPVESSPVKAPTESELAPPEPAPAISSPPIIEAAA